MEKISLFESFNINTKNKQVNENDYNNIMDLLNELSELDPKCKYLSQIFNVLQFPRVPKIILNIFNLLIFNFFFL